MDEEKGLNDVQNRLEKENHLIAERIKKLSELKEKYVLPFRFEKKHSNKQLQEKATLIDNLNLDLNSKAQLILNLQFLEL